MILALDASIASKLSLAAVAATPPLRGQLAHLTPLDIAVIAIYFAMVLFIGFYLRQASNTSEQFFLAGREMTAWIAGLSFVSANMGSLELMGGLGPPISTAFWRRTGIGSAPFRPCCFLAW